MTDDRLFELLPAVYRLRDSERGGPLRALLRVIGEQVQAVEEDIAGLYENWFIETCQDWTVPYIGDLVGFRASQSAVDPRTPALLSPRRAIAHVVRDRRRKGTLALLESLAEDLADRPARAVEFYRLLGVTQPVRLLGTSEAVPRMWLRRGRTTDLRQGDALDLLGGPHDSFAHTVDVRRPTSHRTPGRYNIPSTGLFVRRLNTYPVVGTQALCLEDEDPHRYTFSALGNDTPLFANAGVPAVIRRRALERDTEAYYGPGRSLEISTGDPLVPVPARDITAADLSGWQYRPRAGKVVVDPQTGRMVFAHDLLPAADSSVVVSYRYGFSADLGGGPYERPLFQRADSVIHRVSGERELRRRLAPWLDGAPPDRQPAHAVIEITDSQIYDLPRQLTLGAGHSLQLRAANRRRPVIRMPDSRPGPDALRIRGLEGSSLTLDGLLVTGNALRVEGGLRDLTIRHCTLVPGWGLRPDCEPRRPAKPSLILLDTDAGVRIEHSITGSVEVSHDPVRRDPERLRISDSIVDATSSGRAALCGLGGGPAHAVATFERVTVIGHVHTHAIELAEDSVFAGRITVERRQWGCVRFCYVTPGSITPRRFECQPDLAVADAVGGRRQEYERVRVRPAFDSTRYGLPEYCRLSTACPQEISEGSEDTSQMGAFHDLYEPQRAARLRAGLDEYTPFGSDAGVIDAD
ncbi:hypothetical protein [Streptomyces sp. NPDC060065]|uniref:hypothetical protein n=1 Tax=Streptomyces sp. NPDC060065 TaxID=3347050 RepID=UPI00368544CE